MWPPPPPCASTRVLIDLALDPELAQDRGRDLLDRLAGRIDASDAFAAHQVLRLLDLEAAILQLGVLAVGPALLPDLAQPLRRDGQAVEPRLVGAQGLGKLRPVKVL